eukprot:COSAG05_NODE_1747_length_4151_cov_4.600197_4_plen_53_part_00
MGAGASDSDFNCATDLDLDKVPLGDRYMRAMFTIFNPGAPPSHVFPPSRAIG